MKPIWLRVTHRQVEIAVVVALLGLSVLILREAYVLGPTWGVSGPDPGLFPFVLTVLVFIGLVGVVVSDILLAPSAKPFFEVQDEVTDVLKVGLPILAVVFLMGYLGLYLTSGLYIAFFMAWYGKFRWYEALAGGVILPVALWLMLREGFNISMPMSMLYRKGILPF